MILVETTRGFYSVEHPESGEEIRVDEPFETTRETFELLKEHYSGFGVVETDSGTENPGGSGGEDTTPECTKESCSRKVKGGGRCWQHLKDGET